MNQVWATPRHQRVSTPAARKDTPTPFHDALLTKTGTMATMSTRVSCKGKHL